MNRTPERIGKYRIIREIGRGATAVVYLAESADYPAPVALKHVRFDDKVKDEAKWNRRLLKLLKAETHSYKSANQTGRRTPGTSKSK